MHKLNLKLFARHWMLLVGIFSLLLAFGWGPFFFQEQDQKAEGERIFSIFEAKEKSIIAEMERISAQIQSGKGDRDLWLTSPGKNLEKSGLYFTVSCKDTLVYWTSSLVAFDNIPAPVKQEGMLKKLPTGWFYIFSSHSDSCLINGYMLIKRDFPYQNRYIRSEFQEDFALSSQCEVFADERPGSIQVFCHEGKFHFGIQFRNMPNGSSREEIPSIIFFLLFLASIFSYFIHTLAGQKLHAWPKFGATLLFAIFFYFILCQSKLPGSVYSGKLFAPVNFAWGPFLSSLGDYLLVSILLFFIAHSFFVFFRKAKFSGYYSAGAMGTYLVASVYFVVSIGLFLVLLNNSDLSLELYSNYALSVPNLLATAGIALQMIGMGAILIRLKSMQPNGNGHIQIFTPILLSLGVVLVAVLTLGVRIPFVAVAVYCFVAVILAYAPADILTRYKLSFLLVYGILIAFGLNFVTQAAVAERKLKIQQVMAVNLASERDPAAEIFFSDFESKISKDTLIQGYLAPPYKKLENYLKENYFTGFWKSYDLQITVCEAKDSVYLPDERRRYPCRGFFNQLKSTKGVPLPGSGFYLMDRLNGRISYLGELLLTDVQTKVPVTAYIELNSKIVPEGKGYPQLLMDQQAVKRNRDAGYSYAKYFDNKLVDRGGSFLYDPHLSSELLTDNNFTFFEKGGFSHCLYKRGENNYVVVSFPIVSWVEKGRGFPPVFLLIYLLGFLWIAIGQRMNLIPRNRIELRGKIQLTLVSTLLVALGVIGFGLVNYNYREFQRSMKETLDQKVRAVSSELGLRIGHTLRPDTLHDYLVDQLVEISDITWTDINVYDLKGRMLASSRNEIFEKGLISGQMNPQAFRAMSVLGSATFLHNENLGKMEFFSVYSPLYNRSDELVGYVNLPYFNRQDEFTRQVSGFIVAFVNLYIFLVLIAMIIALIISTKLTAPLLLIEQKLKGIALGKQNAMIGYQAEDEIGRLVEAYNRKVRELEVSAELLARSERESAWKEMARQIAHEINNPLTPMKLNIQYLQKIKDQGSANFDDYFDRVTKMLVAQIDALSEIASAFSDFARLPSVHIEKVELTGLIREVGTLFDSPDEYDLKISLPAGLLFVSGDRDQLRRALVNIVRNASQAIQNINGGKILIEVCLLDKVVRIVVRDNGPGIPETDRERLFEPNFTTRSGGMGLGLAITKSILENYNAEISFTSKPGETCFFIDMPLLGGK